MTPLELAALALKEDRVDDDRTSQCLKGFLSSRQQDPSFLREFVVVAKKPGVFCGQSWIQAVAQLTGLECRTLKKDGDSFDAGALLLKGKGAWTKVLSTERTLLNQLQWLCGVATLTRDVVTRVHETFERGRRELSWVGSAPLVLHTRKTRAGHRLMDVEAVCAGGGHRHRSDLASSVLLKENHKILALSLGLKWADLVKSVVEQEAQAWIEVESKTEAFLALKSGARRLLLDNFSPAKLQEALSEFRSMGYLEQMQIEISGGLTLQNVSSFVMPGVHRLSLGSLTHSAQALDLSLDWAL